MLGVLKATLLVLSILFVPPTCVLLLYDKDAKPKYWPQWRLGGMPAEYQFEGWPDKISCFFTGTDFPESDPGKPGETLTKRCAQPKPVLNSQP